MIQKLRKSLAALFFCAVTLLFLDFTGLAEAWLGWVAKIQFLPALLAANFAVVAALAVITLLFGRIYCSVICPLGVLQDIVFFKIGGKRKRNSLSYKAPKTYLRIAVFALFAVCTLFGFLSAVSLIAPYGAYGRIASNIFAPIWALGNNALAFVAERFDSYMFYPTEVWTRGIGAFVVAAATLAIVGFLAWKGGRTYCNTICPVGTVLGFLAKYSLFKPIVDIPKCNSCGLCARNCKGQCINYKEHKIDYSRCVACFDCIENCRRGAISYSCKKGWGKSGKSDSAKPAPKSSAKIDSDRADSHAPIRDSETSSEFSEIKSSAVSTKGRRGFFSSLLLFAGAAAAKAEEKITDGGLAPIKNRRKPERTTRITPPGARSARNFSEKCVACQLCVSACPSHVLKPSASLSGFMQPEMSYERGHCAIDCVECSKVCPAGAILPITLAEKSSLQIGRAMWHKERCIVNTDDVQCDNCFRQCPTGAITMVAQNPKDKKSRKIPTVDEARCIGCGACENLCPARPVAAICVEGNSVHNSI